ncbi:MAG: DUF4340 domain-containing protein [Myxococcales bacterium]|nr:DUF4340 domain-containing protein [Myxococcales bacterium]
MRQVIMLSVCLALTMLWSYFIWTDESEELGDSTTFVYSGSERNIESISWDSEDSTTVISRRSDDKGDYLWVESTTRKKTPRPVMPDPEKAEEEEEAEEEEPAEDPHDHEGEHDEEEEEAEEEEPEVEYDVETTTTAFLANAQADDLFKSFGPLQALRALRLTSDMGTDAFGFDDPSANVTVKRRNDELALVVGGETYGSKDRYVANGDRYFLVDDATLRPLEFASTRLVERGLFPITAEEASKVDVQLPSGSTVTFVQQNADDPTAAFWARPSDPNNADETAGTWIDKLFRVRLRGYVADDEVEGQPQPVFSYVVHDEEGGWNVQILRSDVGEDTKWYAKADYNRSMVSIPDSLVTAVVDDLDAISD